MQVVENREAIGTVVALWRYPVKSMMGEELNAADLTERGVHGDRPYALLDVETGKVASAKNPRKWPNLFDHRASFVEPPNRNNAIPPVRIMLPDGSIFTSDQPDINRRLSAELGREVTLTAAAPSEPELEESWPNIEGLAHNDLVTDEAMPQGTFFDLSVLHILTTAPFTGSASSTPRDALSRGASARTSSSTPARRTGLRRTSGSERRWASGPMFGCRSPVDARAAS